MFTCFAFRRLSFEDPIHLLTHRVCVCVCWFALKKERKWKNKKWMKEYISFMCINNARVTPRLCTYRRICSRSTTVPNEVVYINTYIYINALKTFGIRIRFHLSWLLCNTTSELLNLRSFLTYFCSFFYIPFILSIEFEPRAL